jgi:hypothetical protein
MSNQKLPPISFRLPLPQSKNRRVQVRHQTAWRSEGGVPVQRTKAVVYNSKEWKQYIENTILHVKYERQIRLPHPTENQRVLIQCHWYLRNDRTDCCNFHDLLADGLKEALEIDDKHFLIQDIWSEVDKEDPRVEITLSLKEKSKEEKP